VTQLESALHILAVDPFDEAAPADLADRALGRARQRSQRRAALAVIGAATVAALVAVGVTATAADQQRNRTSTPAATTPAIAEPRLNVLLIGSDAAPDRIGVRPDTIMLASVNTKTGDSTLISFPRNLQAVPFPAGSPGAKAWPKGYRCAHDACLLNSIWFWAESDPGYRKYRDPGLTATTQAIEQISGLHVDDTVVVNLRGLVDLVDAVGGVKVTVRERLPIGGTSNPASPGYERAAGWIEKGTQRLTGSQALWYARSRWSTDDYDRMRRQQCLITALTDQVDARKLLTAYPKLAKTLRDNLRTSLTPKDLVGWVDLAGRIKDARIQRIGLIPANPSHPDWVQLRSQVTKAVAGKAQASPTSGAAADRGGEGWVSEGPC
jgi:LCP family protein required for cell wall assembly